MWEFEAALFDKGIESVAGVDEAGRGPWAGPVVAAAVIVSRNYEFCAKINDSKKLSPRQRRKAFEEITAKCLYSYAVADQEYIDRYNILNAALFAMAQAVNSLKCPPGWVIVDGPHKPDIPFPCTAVIDGDAKSISVACASIVAKVIRDEMMCEYDKQYPQYGFSSHKGYGTKAHADALNRFGPCPLHRKSFRPIKEFLKNTE
ncbi:MAG: ribonuclease HII [Candidatus Omnitrophica bacterium]|nr:ribonuclease HII [Candidatus Omnitrophota bacterium]MBU4478784.1 ribonuclease HII [Candidatus Omnitrophota bacterium]MCG2703673.1 ribonuclease HII [Candidatus Omnitrophota bacterium]